MKEPNSQPITLALAFDAARLFFDKLSNKLDASDLFTLAFEMERSEETWLTNDPALDDEWAVEWGSDPFKDSAGAFQVVARFLERERCWSEERDLQLLLERCKKVANEGPESDLELAEGWNNALAACSNIAYPQGDATWQVDGKPDILMTQEERRAFVADIAEYCAENHMELVIV